jgi:hypothetical protein
MELFYIFIP